MIYKISIRPPVWLVFYRPKWQKAIFCIHDHSLEIFWWNLVQIPKMTKWIDWRKKNLVTWLIVYFTDRSVKYHLGPLHISRTTIGIDLKFWPVIDIDDIRWHAKFQVGYLSGWYFTDRSVFYQDYSFSGQPLVGFTWNFVCVHILSSSITGQIFRLIPFVILEIWISICVF